MWTSDNDHGAQLQFHTGRHALEGPHPTVGSWVRYGLGSLNDDLPSFVVLGKPLADCCGGQSGHGGNYLGPEYSGVPLLADPKNPLPFLPGKAQSAAKQREQFDLIGKLRHCRWQSLCRFANGIAGFLMQPACVHFGLRHHHQSRR